MQSEQEIRALTEKELSEVSGGVPIITVAGHTLTTGDVASAASRVWGFLTGH